MAENIKQTQNFIIIVTIPTAAIKLEFNFIILITLLKPIDFACLVLKLWFYDPVLDFSYENIINLHVVGLS